MQAGRRRRRGARGGPRGPVVAAPGAGRLAQRALAPQDALGDPQRRSTSATRSPSSSPLCGPPGERRDRVAALARARRSPAPGRAPRAPRRSASSASSAARSCSAASRRRRGVEVGARADQRAARRRRSRRARRARRRPAPAGAAPRRARRRSATGHLERRARTRPRRAGRRSRSRRERRAPRGCATSAIAGSSVAARCACTARLISASAASISASSRASSARSAASHVAAASRSPRSVRADHGERCQRHLGPASPGIGVRGRRGGRAGGVAEAGRRRRGRPAPAPARGRGSAPARARPCPRARAGRTGGQVAAGPGYSPRWAARGAVAVLRPLPAPAARRRTAWSDLRVLDLAEAVDQPLPLLGLEDLAELLEIAPCPARGRRVADVDVVVVVGHREGGSAPKSPSAR